MLQTIRPVLTVTAATLGSLAFTALIDCQPSLYLWDKWYSNRSVSKFYKDKNVWIIGASSGIGEELAYQLARSGCSNLILSSRNAKDLENVATKCNKASPSSSCQCFCRPLDILCGDGEDAEALEDRFEDLIQNHLPPFPLDIIIFNAGAGQLRPAIDTSAKAIEKIMNVNALWPMILTPLLFKYDVFQSSPNDDAQKKPQQPTGRKRRAHIMVTNSIAAQLPVPLSSVYAASKAAQAHYFASMATEQPDNRIRVDMICPGPVETKFHQNHLQIQGDTQGSEDLTTAATTSEKQSKSQTKMSVERCVHLMLAAMARDSKGAYREVWIAPSPLISVLYVQRIFPGLLQKLTTKFGQKRVQLWREGKDLYDPKSWK